MKRPGVPPIQVPIEELDGLLEQARPALSAEGYQKLHAAIRTLVYVTELLEQKETTLAALRELLCPASTEKTDKVLQQAGVQTGGPGPESAAQKPKRAAAGHHAGFSRVACKTGELQESKLHYFNDLHGFRCQFIRLSIRAETAEEPFKTRAYTAVSEIAFVGLLRCWATDSRGQGWRNGSQPASRRT